MKGKGIFVFYPAFNNRIVLQKLIDNVSESKEQKQALLNVLQKKIESLPEEECPQMAFSEDSNGEPFFYDEMTKEELIERLRMLAEVAP